MKEIKVIQIRDDSTVADFDTIQEAEIWIEQKQIPQLYKIK